MIFSTARGGESAAKDFERQIRMCPHLSSDAALALERAERAMAGVETLLRAGHYMADQADHSETSAESFLRAQELSELAGVDFEELEALLEEAVQAERKAQEAGASAHDLVGDVAATDVVRRAEDGMVEVDESLRDLRTTSVGVGLRRRLEVARVDLDRLRDRLGSR